MLGPWLEADIWQQTADHLTVPVQLVFDRGTENHYFSKNDLYYLHLPDLFLVFKPIIVKYWKLLLLLFE